jgi:biotin-(acetyl-CoA carboxylase) ligase
MTPLFVGRTLIEHEHLDSTNSYALKVLRDQNVPEGTVIFTENQTKDGGKSESMGE